MLLDHITHEQARAALGAMRAVAEAAGGLHPDVISWLSVCARAFGTDDNPALIQPANVEEVARCFASEIERERVIQCMLIMSLMDGKADREEAELIEHFARKLAVREERIQSLRELAEGRLTRMFLGFAWRSLGQAEWIRTLRTDARKGAWKIVGPLLGAPAEQSVSKRFTALELLSSGTLGRTYFDWIKSNGYPFSGEPGGVPEEGVWQDLVRLLAGYELNEDGEVQTSSLIAGFRKEDPFFWLFTTALQFHVGLKVSPYSPGGQRGGFSPERVAAAYARGQLITCDLSNNWDWWPLMAEPLIDVRKSLGFL